MELPNKQYKVIYADPPWQMRYLTELKAGFKTLDMPYNTLSDRAIMNLDIKSIAADNSLLFLWVIDSRIPMIKELFAAWGFEYVTVGFIWHKIALNTLGDGGIITNYTRKSCELCFIGRRGKMININKRVPQFISQPKREHSRKPDIIRTRIYEMCGDVSRIELFARQRFEGWDLWGDQAPTTMQRVLRKW